MNHQTICYRFGPAVPPEEIEATLLLAVLAAESLHGCGQVQLDAAHAWDAAARVCTIDATTAVGRDLNKLFFGFVGREFGADAFRIERRPLTPASAGEVAA